MTAKYSHSESWRLLRWIGKTALKIDDYLRRLNRVRDYSNDPRCVFRMQLCEARRDMVLADGVVVRRGDKMLNIHLWNEHIPEMPPAGPTMAWARRMAMKMEFSLRQLSGYMAANPECADVVAIGANTAISTARTTTQLLRIMQHYGFHTVPDDAPVSIGERVHQWGENLLALLLVIAVNPAAARISVLSRVRSQVLQSRLALDMRYGTSAVPVCDSAREHVSRPPFAGVAGRPLSASVRVSAAPRT